MAITFWRNSARTGGGPQVRYAGASTAFRSWKDQVPHVDLDQQPFPTYCRERITPNIASIRPWLEMLTSRLLRLLVLAALISAGGEIAVARDGPGSDFSALLEWRNQIAAELEHNKRYLPAIRTRGKIGVVKFELNINRSGWVLPGTRIVTVDPDLGRVALLLLQQSQPFPAPDNFKLPDSSFRLVASIRFNDIPSPEAAGFQDLEHRKLSECYEADRQELQYQRRRAASRNAPLPTMVFRTPEGCPEAKRQQTERQRSAVEVIE